MLLLLYVFAREDVKPAAGCAEECSRQTSNFNVEVRETPAFFSNIGVASR
jgi:hypothetical protein